MLISPCALPPFPLPLACTFNESDRLHEHAGRSAARVVHTAPVRLDHFNQQLDHTARRVELAALLALGARELRQEVFVDPTQYVPGAGFGIAHPDVADEVDELTEPLLVERLTGVVLGQHIPERRVVALDPRHGVVHELADFGLPCLGPELFPPCFGRHPEDVLLQGIRRGPRRRPWSRGVYWPFPRVLPRSRRSRRCRYAGPFCFGTFVHRRTDSMIRRTRQIPRSDSRGLPSSAG